MPQLANIVIKKSDGTTDITWTGDVASAGDRSPARFSSKSVSSIPAYQPKMEVTSRDNQTKDVRRIDVNITYPYAVTDSTTTLTQLVSRLGFTGTWTVPQGIPSTLVDEFAAQVANLLDSVLLVDTVKSQSAPT